MEGMWGKGGPVGGLARGWWWWRQDPTSLLVQPQAALFRSLCVTPGEEDCIPPSPGCQSQTWAGHVAGGWHAYSSRVRTALSFSIVYRDWKQLTTVSDRDFSLQSHLEIPGIETRTSHMKNTYSSKFIATSGR